MARSKFVRREIGMILDNKSSTLKKNMGHSPWKPFSKTIEPERITIIKKRILLK